MRWILIAMLTTGCMVSKKKYDALQSQYDTSVAAVAERDAKITDLDTAIAAEQAHAASLDQRIVQLTNQIIAQNKELDELRGDKAKLVKDRSRLKASVEEMEEALADLSSRKMAADKRVAAYQDLLGRFQKLIDAGKLEVKIVDGRMIVVMATDILFQSGKATLSDDGKAALIEVGTVLASIPERRYQVEGHTDNVPIKTERYPSNWELGSDRAVTVVRTLIEAGVAPVRLSAASYSEFQPVNPNTDDTGKASNRRIEIVVVPDLSDLPGFDELKKAATP